MAEEKPLPFIYLNKKQKFELGSEAIKMLSKIKGKIGCVAIAGLYRTGKSYVLNRIIGKQRGFEVGGTVNACTKGIYIWGKPILVKNGDGTELNVILIDTEGIGSIDKEATYDAQIFSFAVLLSSYFVYNSMGVIDENALEKLSFIANLTKHIHVHSEVVVESSSKKEKKKQPSLTSLTPYFPSFLWLLRDFALRLVDKENNPISAKEYLENALHSASKDASKNEIRESILQVFTNRDCLTLPRPVEDEDDLQNLDNIEYDKLRDKFRSGMAQVSEKIFHELQPKYVFGKPINGQAFINLAKNYVDSINSGSVPTIQNAWRNVSELECQHGLEEAMKQYIQLMNEINLPKNSEEFIELHEKAYAQALNTFKLSALGDSSEVFREKLQEQIDDQLKVFKRKNANASETLCKELLSSLYLELDKKVQASQFKTSHELKEEWKRLKDTYFSRALGPSVFQTLASFLLERMPDSLISVNELQMQQQKKEFENARDDLKNQIQTNSKLIDHLQELVNSKKKEKEELEKENQSLKQEIQELKTKLMALEGEKKEAIALLQENDTITLDVKTRKRKCVIM